MAAQAPQSAPVGPDTLITVKVIIDGTNRRFKLALRDLGAHVLPQKVCKALCYIFGLAPFCTLLGAKTIGRLQIQCTGN